VSPILDSIGSVKGFGWGSFLSANSYESIATSTAGAGGLSSVTFSSIPSTYKHLQIRATARIGVNNPGNDGGYVGLRFNSDTGTNYTTHIINGNGATAGSTAWTGINEIYFQRFAGNNTGANIFGAGVLDILDYQNTNKNTTIRNLAGFDNNGGGLMYLTSGLWLNTSAITSITLTPEAGNFLQYSSLALYGIKG
jgi:hypothetical protein